MQKTAQKRSLLNRLKEMTNVSGKAAEKFFNPEFQKVMESLREKDDTIRSIIAGEKIGDGDYSGEKVSMKTLVKSAKSDFNKNEFMLSVSALSRFHKRAMDVISLIDKLNFDVNKIHTEFLFKDLGDEQKEHLRDLHQRFATQQNVLIKEAGIMDFLHNISTKRGRALALWKKRYPEETKKLERATQDLIGKSEDLLEIILTQLKEMASARAERHIDNYVSAAKKISDKYKPYNTTFKTYYNEQVKKFLERTDILTTKPDGTIEAPKDWVISKPSSPTFDAELDQKSIPLQKELDFGLGEPEPSKPESSVIEVSTHDPDNDLEYLPTAKTTPAQIPMYEEPPTRPGPPPFMDTTELTPSQMYRQIKTPGAIPGLKQSPGITLPGAVPAPPTMAAPPKHTIPFPGIQEEDGAPNTIPESNTIRSAHTNFISSLEVMSGESPIIIASYIRKYANKIKESDPRAAIKLFKIANTLTE